MPETAPPFAVFKDGISQIWSGSSGGSPQPFVHVVVMQQSPTWRRANESFSVGTTRAVESNSARVCASLDKRRRPEENGKTGRKRTKLPERSGLLGTRSLQGI